MNRRANENAPRAATLRALKKMGSCHPAVGNRHNHMRHCYAVAPVL